MASKVQQGVTASVHQMRTDTDFLDKFFDKMKVSLDNSVAKIRMLKTNNIPQKLYSK